MDRRSFLIGLPLALSACSAEQVWAPDDVVARAIHSAPGPKHLTLYTVKNVQSDNGAHTGLLVNASQRVMFDPAGSFRQTQMPERNDVLFGVTPRLEEFYASFHARVTYYVTAQKVQVAPEVAERALNLVLQAGPVPQAMCARSTSRILRQLPGFESVRQTWSPNNIEKDVALIPGVETREYREADEADKSVAAARIDATLRVEQ
ncbi:hypothetical protein [Loktanella sp. Alg231-35]|uniref:hypothetical protein n=1 Tax=Loktanella sp. Alg231-35 TaxID=1922220 RepID=UPI000D5529DC|nr:hypothetical protein [Loktanella sp. Alg231-35]